ncbi:MAG TPA: hypothetical protein GX503_05485 [Clostridiales bacterium]|nr:hypothetical protein [Clostridiales bacterium]
MVLMGGEDLLKPASAPLGDRWLIGQHCFVHDDSTKPGMLNPTHVGKLAKLNPIMKSKSPHSIDILDICRREHIEDIFFPINR